MILEMLADRIRTYFDGDPRIRETKGFGGIMFMLNNNMVAAAKKDGRVLLSVGKQAFDAALMREGASAMQHGEKIMRGFVWVDAYAVEEDADLREWLDFAVQEVEKMPPK